jgi:hypothetical protein
MYSDEGEKIKYIYRIQEQKPLENSHSEDREMKRKMISKRILRKYAGRI